MKKASLFTLFTFIIIFALLSLSGCTGKDTVASVSLKDNTPETVIELAVGKFDYGAHKIVVTYESGDTEELDLKEEMISESDLFKLYQVGEHEITVSYGGKSCSFKISVRRMEFTNLAFSENTVFTYDGAPHSAELLGDIPANAVVTYPGGNSFINAGNYDVTAIVSCDGYVTQRLTTTVTIERAKYDMSGVHFYSKEVVYDGKAHSLEITGTLPEGVSAPKYSISDKETSSATDAGEYTVRARFVNTNINYENIPDMVATLKIIPAVYDLTGIDIIFKNEDGSVIDGLKKVYDGKSVSFEISNKTIVGNKITVSYMLGSQALATPQSFTDAGVYTVKMAISLIEGKNYQPIEPILRTFEIKKAKYDISEIYFDSDKVIYDGNAHKLTVSLPEGHDIKPEDVIYEYTLDGKTIEVDASVGVTDAGVYTVRAIFPDKNKNYEQITDVKPATLKIEKQRVDISSVGFSDKAVIEYNGADYEPKFVTWQEIKETEYEVFAYSARQYYKLSALGEYELLEAGEKPNGAGKYRCTVELRIADEYKNNYVLQSAEEKEKISFDFEIHKKEIDLSEVDFENFTGLVYSGNAQVPKFNYQGYESLIEVESTKYLKMNELGEYLEINTRPTAIGYYRAVVTVRVLDEANHTLLGNMSAVDFICDYEIGIPPFIDVRELLALDTHPLIYKCEKNLTEDLRPEIEAIVNARLEELMPDDKDTVLIRFYKNQTQGVTTIPVNKVGEYSIVLQSANSTMFYDGSEYHKSVTVMRVIVCEIVWEVGEDGVTPVISGYSNKNGFADLGLKVSLVVDEGVSVQAVLEALPGYELYWTQSKLRSFTPNIYYFY